MGYTGVAVFICHDTFLNTQYRGPTQGEEGDRPTLRRLPSLMKMHRRRSLAGRSLDTVPKVEDEAQLANVLTVSVRPHVREESRTDND